MFVDEFLADYERSLYSALGKMKGVLPPVEIEFVLKGGKALLAAAQKSDTILFTASTMLMLADKLEHYEQTVQKLLQLHARFSIEQAFDQLLRDEGFWLLFPQPLTLSAQDSRQITAFFCMIPAQVLSTGKDQMLLYLVAPDKTVTEVFEYEQVEKQWFCSPDYHRCPFGQCTHPVQGTEVSMMLCPQCQRMLDVWVHIFSLCAIIAGQYLAARRYEERQMTGFKRTPRAHNDKKSRRDVVTRIYKVIDANELIIPVSPDPDDAQYTHKETDRFSWVAQAYLEGDLDRRTITTRPFSRTYRSPRYVNVQGTTQDFPQGITRAQPIRRSRQGTHITKVKASAYEHETEQKKERTEKHYDLYRLWEGS